MFVYRITNKKYKEQTLSGIGAEKVGGRWNEIGTRAVYCSENISLAMLEYYIHSKNNAFLPKEILIAKIEFPDDFLVNEIDVLPERWNQYPYSSKTTKVFTLLTREDNFFALKIPSAIVPFEFNVILNPMYKDFSKVNITEFIELPLDERL